MALPSSGTISLTMIAAEFGVALPRSITQFYRGGGIVPNTPANAGVPTSGAISLTNFYGATAYTPVSANYSGTPDGNTFQAEPAPANAFVTSGLVTINASGGNASYTYAWTHLSGNAVVAVTNPSAGSTTFTATVAKNAARSAVKRCTVSDGTSSATVDVPTTLSYTTDA